MDWIHLGIVLFGILGFTGAQQGYNYPKPKTPFSDSQSSFGGLSQSTGTSTQPDSQKPFGTQQPSHGYPSGSQPGAPSGTLQPFTGFSGTSSDSRPDSQRPYGTQQPSGGYTSGVPSGTQQPFTGFPGTGSQIPFGAQQSSSSQPGVPSGTQQPGTGSQIPFGTQQSSSGQPSGASSGTRQPFTGLASIGPSIKQGYQSTFGTQQPSGGYPSQQGTPSGTQQPFTGFPGPVKSDSQSTFGTQQASGGYSSQGEALSGTRQTGISGITPGPFGTQQPSTGYPSAGQSRTPTVAQTSFGTQQSSYPAPVQTGIPSGSTFGTQQSVDGYSGRTQPGTFTQSPFGSQPTSAGYPSTAQPGAPGVTQRPFVTQPPSYTDSGRTTGASTGFPGQQRPEGGVEQQFTGSNFGRPVSQQGTSYGPQRSGTGRALDFQRPGVNAPSGDREQDLNVPNLGRQQGYNYPSPQKPFGQTGEIVNGVDIPTGTRTEPSGSRTDLGQGPSGEVPSRDTSITGSRLPSVGGSEFGSTNGYSSPRVTERPSAQFPSGSSRPSGAEQTPNGYSQSGRPQDFTPSPGQPRYQGKQGRGEFSREGSTGQFPVEQTGYPGSELTTGDVTQPSGNFGGQGSIRRPTGGSQSERPTTQQFSTNGIKQTSSERPLSSAGIPSGQGINDYSSTTTREQSQGFPGTISRVGGRPSQFPSTLSGTSQNGQRPLSSYLPPGTEQGTGKLPLAEVPSSRFTSGGPTSLDSNGLTKPTGGISISGTPSGPQFQTSEQPIRSQNGFGRSGTPTSVPSEQSTGSQNGYSAPTGRESSGRSLGLPFPSGQRQIEGTPQRINGYATPEKSSVSEQFDRPSATGRSEPGYSLDQALREGFPRRTGGQTYPGSQQGPQEFGPTQRRPSDEEGTSDDEEEGDFSAIPGQPGRDYPILAEVPETSFSCDAQEYRGYYADVETRCQIFHICANNKTYDFLCPNGTIFHQEHLVCVWWDQFDCNTAPSLYRINEHIYDFSIIGAQQTGGIPMPGQDYPDIPDGQLDFQQGRAPGSQVSSQGPQRPSTQFGGSPGVGIQIPGSQRPGGYPSDGGQGPISTTYPSGIGSGVERPGGYSPRPQGPVGPSSTAYPRGRSDDLPSDQRFDGPQGASRSSTGYPNQRTQETGSYQTPGLAQVPGARTQQSSGGYPSGTEQRTQQPQAPSRESQRPGGYASEGSQGSAGLDQTRYPSERPQGTGYQLPGRESQRPGSAVQELERRPSGFPSDRTQRPSGEELQSQGYPSGQYRGEDISRPTLPESRGVPQNGELGGSQTTPGRYEPLETSRSQPQGPGTSPSGPQDFRGYSTGTTPRPGFPSSNSQTSGSASPFPGSPQPHDPNREYLPPV